MRKRGLSTVVTTLIIVLLVMVAVGVVWVVIANLIVSGSEEISLGKFTINMQIENVNVKGDGTVDVKVKRNPGKGDLTGIKFLINDGVEVFEFEETTTMGELGQRTFTLPYDGAVKDISIAPLFELDSGKESIGNEIDFEDLSGKSCYEILRKGYKTNTIYYIDPDGTSGEDGFEVYCDMTTDGGGWTLIMKTRADTTTFHYLSGYWTTDNTHQENDVSIQVGDSKYDSFNDLEFSSLRGCVDSATENCITHNFGTQKSSALDLFNEPESPPCIDTNNGGSISFADFESVFGFNLYAGACRGGPVFNKPDTGCGSGDTKIRWGIYTDEAGDCTSENEVMGWGLTNDGTAPGSAGSGGYTPRMTHQGKNTWLWVR